MTTATLTLTAFLLARIAEDEVVAKAASAGPWKRFGMAGVAGKDWEIVDERRVECECGEPVALLGCATNDDATHIARHDPARVLAECEAKRRIVEFHESWPVLVETPPTFEEIGSEYPSQVAFRASQQVAWLTTREYRSRFGDDPPSSPMLRALAAVYADHPDYREEWS